MNEEEKHCSIHFIPNDSIQTDSCTKHCENDREIGINIDSKLNHYSGSEFRDQKCDTSFDPKDAIQHSLKIEHDNLLVYTNCKEDHCAAVNNSTYIYEVVSLPSPNVRKATDGQQDSIDIEPSTRTDLTKEAIINDCMMDVQTNEIAQPVLPIENNRQQNYYVTVNGKGDQCLMKLDNSNFDDKNNQASEDALWKVVHNDKRRPTASDIDNDVTSETPSKSNMNLINIMESSENGQFRHSPNRSAFNSLHSVSQASSSLNDVKFMPSCGYQTSAAPTISHFSGNTNLVSTSAFLTGLHQPSPITNPGYGSCPVYPTPQLSSTPYRTYKHSSEYSSCLTAFCSMNSCRNLVNLTSSGDETATSSSDYSSPSCYLRVPQNTPESKTSDCLSMAISPKVELSSHQFSPTSLQSKNANNFGCLDNSCRLRLSHESSKLCHNEKERLRRNRIKNACSMLQKAIPGLSDKTDKATLLEVAVRYLYHLKTFVTSDCDKRFVDEFTM